MLNLGSIFGQIASGVQGNIVEMIMQFITSIFSTVLQGLFPGT